MDKTLQDKNKKTTGVLDFLTNSKRQIRGSKINMIGKIQYWKAEIYAKVSNKGPSVQKSSLETTNEQ